jgi:hypothetical protein
MKTAALEAMAEMITAGTYLYRGQERRLAPGIQESECVERLGDIVQYYIDNQLALDMLGAEVVAVEQNFQMPLSLLYAIEGQIDLILKKEIDGNTVYRIFDHKTIGESDSVRKNLDFLRLDVQFLVYEWLVTRYLQDHAADETNFSVEMVYNIIRRQRPPGYGTRELRYNQNGSVSKTNASQDPADYLSQTVQAHSAQELEYVEKELQHLSNQATTLIHAAKFDEDRGYFTRTRIKYGEEACTNCDFFTKCAAELLGHGRPVWDMKAPSP